MRTHRSLLSDPIRASFIVPRVGDSLTLIHGVMMFEVLMAGELKKRDGVMRKKWIDVYVELRENSLTCFHSKEDRQILDTVMGEFMF